MTLGRLALAALTAFFALASAQPAFGDGGRKPLDGEEMLVQDATVTFDCNPATTSTIVFSASGIAVGPYTGPFTVSGTVTVGPQTMVGPRPGTMAGAVTRFHETFTIDSPLGTVTGVKKLTRPNSSSLATCQEVTDFDAGPVVGGNGTVVDVFAQPRYVAKIREPGGNFHDRGDGQISFSEIELDGCGVDCPFRQAAFDQAFLSRQPPNGKDANFSDMDDDIESEVG
jgi:hypothetical protein